MIIPNRVLFRSAEKLLANGDIAEAEIAANLQADHVCRPSVCEWSSEADLLFLDAVLPLITSFHVAVSSALRNCHLASGSTICHSYKCTTSGETASSPGLLLPVRVSRSGAVDLKDDPMQKADVRRWHKTD